MKHVETTVVFDVDNCLAGEAWNKAYTDLIGVIQAMEHPAKAGSFSIRKRVDNENRNGVAPFKAQFFSRIAALPNWESERPIRLNEYLLAEFKHTPFLRFPEGTPSTQTYKPKVGNLDCVFSSFGKKIALEWETGNISSSHRSINKLCMALQAGLLDGRWLLSQ